MTWAVKARSIRGVSHEKKGTPNQDAWGCARFGSYAEGIALSDGHGGEDYQHSDFGAKAAVDSFLEIVSELSERHEDCDTIGRTLEGEGAILLKQRWLEKISRHEAFVTERSYGCTLLGALRTEEGFVLLQLGDGKVACVLEDQTVYYPFVRDSRFSFNETASLASPDAPFEMSVRVLTGDLKPIAVVLASDGVENAFPYDPYDDAGFYLELLRQSDASGIQTLLEDAAKYSKDDTTAVLLRVEPWPFDDRAPIPARVWAESIPEHWLSLKQLGSQRLSMRLFMGERFINAVSKRGGLMPLNFSEKQLYYDSESDSLPLEVMSPEMNTLDLTSLRRILDKLLGITVASFDSLDEIKAQLIQMRRNLRFDYDTGQEWLDNSGHTIPNVALRSPAGVFEVYFDACLRLSEVIPLTGWENPIWGKVVQHPNKPQIWGIKNLSSHSWPCYNSDGAALKEIPPGKTVTLRHGTCCFIYGIPVKFEINF